MNGDGVTIKKLLSMLSLGSVAMLPSLAMATTPAAVADKADNAFMMICTALVLFMTVPGIALFYGGLLRSKNVLSLMTQVMVNFALVCVLWILCPLSIYKRCNRITPSCTVEATSTPWRL